MIELKNITVKFDTTTVLKDFSLSVEKGEHIALMGSSGSGKTTVLKLIAGLLQPNNGEINVSTDKISYMFQEPRLAPWLTAAENINLVLGDTTESLPEATKWLKKLGMEDAADKFPHELSGGMQQRVALARALAYNGELLLLDEPLSALDESLAETLLAFIKQYAQDKTVIFVTHSTAQAKAFADTIYVIKKQNS
jgi:NitT/TauT family transport system ATP-binding protein